MELDAITAAISEAWRTQLRRVKGWKPRIGMRDYLTASGLSDCGRAMALDLIHPEDREPFDDETLERMRRGDDRETTTVAWLSQVGLVSNPPFRVIGQQEEVEIKGRDGRLLIRGHIEGYLLFGEQHGEHQRVPFEVKSGRLVERVTSIEDMLRNTWTRRYLRQFLAYLLASEHPVGVFILDKPALPAIVGVDLAGDEGLLDFAEDTLQEAERAVAARFGERDLPPFTPDQSLCRRCHHLGKSCHPAMDFGPGAEVDDSEDAAEVLDELLATEESARQHKAAKRYLFGDAERPGRYRGKPLVLVGGRYIVEGKWGPFTTYPVPKEIREQYKKVNPQGAWKKTITKLESTARD